ncbi:MAG: hypothetical protein H6Q00_1912 [Holophagaceae bacterium]|nr:hypothetical protein [Holophagaceae bacterium]
MRKVQLSAWLALVGIAVSAQEVPVSDDHVAVGAYQLNLNHDFGPWKGLLADAAWNPLKNGPFVAGITTYVRPEGNGGVFSIGKYQEFKGGYGFLGVASSTGADYLPSLQVTTDLDLNLPWNGWVLGGGLIYTRVRDGHRDMTFLFGPTYYWGDTVTTLRGSVNWSSPGSLTSYGGQFNFRHGMRDRKAWQAIRVNWGTEAYNSFLANQDVRNRGYSAAIETSWPLGGGYSLQLGAEFARKNNVYDLWGGTVRAVKYF